jgi:putative nucleotidyltransferase with HDIG domain
METSLGKIVILLSRGISQRKLYFADHPKVQACARDFVDHLQHFLAAGAQDEVFVGVVDGKLVHEGCYLVGPSIAGGQLVMLSRLLNCGGLSFGKHTHVDEVRALFSLATELVDPASGLLEARELLQARDIVNIQIAAEYSDYTGLVVEQEKSTWQGQNTGGHESPSPILVYQALFDVVTAAHGSAALGHNLDLEEACAVSVHLLRSSRASFTDIMQLMRYPDYDSYTVGHSVRVATLAVHLGDRMGLDNDQLLKLGTAALLHDVGKSQIPDEIIFKPGRLDADEFKIVESHAVLGAEILLEHTSATPLDIAIAFGHHIRHDGGGYPERPEWAVRQPVTALLQICDVFEALTAIRPYKPALTPQAAYQLMLKDRGAFNPTLLKSFVSALGLYPPGNHVRLSDGSCGTVVASGPEIDKPQVRISHDAAGRFLAESDRLVIDLSAPEQPDLSVAELVLDPESMLV